MHSNRNSNSANDSNNNGNNNNNNDNKNIIVVSIIIIISVIIIISISINIKNNSVANSSSVDVFSRNDKVNRSSTNSENSSANSIVATLTIWFCEIMKIEKWK